MANNRHNETTRYVNFFNVSWAHSQNCEKRLFSSSCPSVCPSVHRSVRMEHLGSHWTDFHEIWCMRIFWKSFEKVQVSLQSDKNHGYFTWRPVRLHSRYLAQSFLEWEIMPKKAVDKIKTHFVFSNSFFFRKSCRLWDNVEKYCTAGQATDDNMTHAHCKLDT